MTLPDPNAQNQNAGNDQTDYKAKYLELSAQIAAGDYVAKNVYVGLQQTHEKTILAHKTDKDNLATMQKTLEEKETALKGLTTQVTDLTTKSGGSETKVKELEIELTRNKLIMSKFPQLAPFEADGLLPKAAEGDDLEKLLTSFNEKLAARTKQDTQKALAGSSDAPAGKDQVQGTNVKSLLDEANVFARQGKWKEYNESYAKYLEASGVGARTS